MSSFFVANAWLNRVSLRTRVPLSTGIFSKKPFPSDCREPELEKLAERRNEKKYGLRELAIADFRGGRQSAGILSFALQCGRLSVRPH